MGAALFAMPLLLALSASYAIDVHGRLKMTFAGNCVDGSIDVPCWYVNMLTVTAIGSICVFLVLAAWIIFLLVQQTAPEKFLAALWRVLGLVLASCV